MSAASLHFLGTGEAFDASLPHTSLLLLAPGTTLLLDCGALVPPELWRHSPSPDAVDAIWISHLHADHAFGLAAHLGRCWEEGRRKPLTLLGAAGIRVAAERILDHGYPGLRARLPFELREEAVEPGQPVSFGGLTLRSALSAHSLPNLAVRVEVPGATPLCYSGDGAPTPRSAALGEGAAWVHECFSLDREVPGHATLRALEGELARRCPARLGLVHVSRFCRDGVRARAQALAAAGAPIGLPEPGDVWEL